MEFVEACLGQRHKKEVIMKKLLLFTVLLSGFSVVDASNPAHLAKAKAGGEQDLRGANLDNSAIADVDLSGSDLRNASVWGTAFNNVKLEGACLVGVTIKDFTVFKVSGKYFTKEEDCIKAGFPK